jgi:hypothetical protein
MAVLVLISLENILASTTSMRSVYSAKQASMPDASQNQNKYQAVNVSTVLCMASLQTIVNLGCVNWQDTL